MLKGFAKFSGILLLSFLTWMTACNKDASTTTTDDVSDFVESALTELRDSANVGTGHCFELVFPITIVFPDETTTEVDSFPELKTALHDWKEANPDSNERPTFKYPLEVLAQDGTIITVTNAEELKALRDSCDMGGHHGPRGPRGGHGGGPGRPGNGGGGNHGNGGDCACFQIVFPVTIQFADGTTKSVADERALRDAARAWHEANPGVEGRPELVFPINVKLTDGTTQAVADAAALKALKESCTGN